MSTEAPNIWLNFDFPDPDNRMLLLTAAEYRNYFNIIGASVIGRPVFQQTAEGYIPDPEASADNRTFAARQIAALVARLDLHVPIFEGSIAPVSPIPPEQHIDERALAINDQGQNYKVQGGLAEAAQLLEDTPGPIHVICGGPMSDMAFLLAHKNIQQKFGYMVAQMGFMGWNSEVETATGGRTQFNIMCDPSAAKKVAAEYPGPFILVPTDITKAAPFSFDSAESFMATMLHNALNLPSAEYDFY